MTKPKATHTSFQKGKRVVLQFRGGRKLIAKFIETKGRRMIFEEGEFRTDEIKSATIYRGSNA